MVPVLKALIFDVDGTLAETEELHRSSFNRVFHDFGFDWYWTTDNYRSLLRTTGGKERIVRFLNEHALPPLEAKLIGDMHAAKNRLYSEAVAMGELKPRAGVRSLVREAGRQGLKLGIATTTSRTNIQALFQFCFSEEERNLFGAVICGEDVSKKKPDPEVYLQCLAKLGLGAAEVIAIEDSATGLAAACAANIPTIVTPSSYTLDDDFTGALIVLSHLPDNMDQLRILIDDVSQKSTALQVM